MVYILTRFFSTVLHTFSFNKRSLRFISGKRLVKVLIYYPLFTVLFVINRMFLLLDEIFFPFYRRTSVSNAVFIIGIPRSATTFLFTEMTSHNRNFHSFKLWELLFAPSIIQKYFLLAVIGIDRLLGRPLLRLSFKIDNLLFGRLKGIHTMGFSLPEEDEVLFLYNLTSLYFWYFFPEVKSMDDYLNFDDKVPDRIKRKIMSFYYRCVQRHNYVFDRKGKRYFLSKNPTFVPKMAAVAHRFPEARFLYPLRSPFSTIPSTISLNAWIYRSFTRLPESYPLAEQTREMILKWYIMADNTLKNELRERCMTIFYKDIQENSFKVFSEIYEFLNCENADNTAMQQKLKNKSRHYHSSHVYDRNTGIDKEIIASRLGSILTPEIMKRI